MDFAERRYRAQKKMNKRKRMLETFGPRGGTTYKRHIEKVNKSAGYMRDHGNVTHYVQVGFGEKTRNRKRYGKVRMLSIRDARKNESLNQSEIEYSTGDV